MKVIIIEDEKLSAEHLTVLLQKIDDSIEVTHYFDSIKTVVNAFQSGLSAELIFMDIHLADGNSFEIFKHLSIEIPIIFTTAYDQYALPAFKQNSIDYLLKPLDPTDLIEAVNILGSFIYGTILGVFLVAFYLKRVGSKAVFYAAILAEAIVCVLGFQEVVAYLWLNVVGCLGVVIFAYLFQKLIKEKAIEIEATV